jgi:hypothetical protein
MLRCTPSTKATTDCSGLVFLSSFVCKFFSFPGRPGLKAGMNQKLLAFSGTPFELT